MSRIFSNHLDAIKELLRELKELGITVPITHYQDKWVRGDKGFYTKELLGYSYKVSQADQKLDEMVQFLYKDKDAEGVLAYCQLELQDRLAGVARNPGNAHKSRYSLWEEFLEDKQKFAYTYSERISDPKLIKDQISNVIEELKTSPDSRQAIVQIFNYLYDHQNIGGKHRIPCFPAGTLIEANNKYIPIEDVVEDDTTTDHKSKKSKIDVVMKRKYKGDLIKIKLESNWNSFRVTPEHEVLALKHNNCSYNSRDFCSPSHDHFQKEEAFIAVKDLRKNDFVVLNFDNKISDDTEITEDKMRLFGYYLAEGHLRFDTRKNKYLPSQIVFNMSAKDEERGYIEDIKYILDKEFGIKTTRIFDSTRKNRRLLVCNRKLAQELYDLFSHRASEKVIPEKVIQLPNEKTKQLLVGFIRGDGSCIKKISRISYSTTSSSIAYGIRTILFRHKVWNSISVNKKYIGIEREIYGRKVIFNKTVYHSSFYDASLLTSIYNLKGIAHKPHKREAFFDNGKIYLRIIKINIEKYNGLVYNLTSNKNQSYSTMHSTVHNCSMHYQFLLRNKKLHGIYVMRSNDLLTHYVVDIWLACKIQMYIAEQVGVDVGSFTYFGGSLHAYFKDFPAFVF